MRCVLDTNCEIQSNLQKLSGGVGSLPHSDLQKRSDQALLVIG